jgi:hypothetical protein
LATGKKKSHDAARNFVLFSVASSRDETPARRRETVQAQLHQVQLRSRHLRPFAPWGV